MFDALLHKRDTIFMTLTQNDLKWIGELFDQKLIKQLGTLSDEVSGIKSDLDRIFKNSSIQLKKTLNPLKRLKI